MEIVSKLAQEARERQERALTHARYFLAKTIDNCENLDDDTPWTTREVKEMLEWTYELLHGNYGVELPTALQKTESPSDFATDATTGGQSPTTTSPTPDAAPEFATAAAPSEGRLELNGWLCEEFVYEGNRAASVSKNGCHIVLSVNREGELPEYVPGIVSMWLLTGLVP